MVASRFARINHRIHNHDLCSNFLLLSYFSTSIGLPIPGYTPATSGGPVENLNKFALEQPLALAQIILAIGIIEGHFFPGEMWFGGGDREGNMVFSIL